MAFIYANFSIILCLIAGIGLIVLEVFLPGFGVPGISGLVLMTIGLVLTMTNYGAIAALGMLIITIAIVTIAVSLSLRSASKGKLSESNLFLKSNDAFKAAPEDMKVFMGKTGIARTDLRPAGIAEFDGVRLDVMTEGDYIEMDTEVTITRVEGGRIVVRRA